MGDRGTSELEGPLHGLPHQGRIHHPETVIGERDCSGVDESADFGEFFAFTVLADTGQNVDVTVVGAGGLMLHVLDAGLRIDRM